MILRSNKIKCPICGGIAKLTEYTVSGTAESYFLYHCKKCNKDFDDEGFEE